QQERASLPAALADPRLHLARERVRTVVRAPLEPFECEAPTLRQQVEHHEPGVVPGAVVLGAGVADAQDDAVPTHDDVRGRGREGWGGGRAGGTWLRARTARGKGGRRRRCGAGSRDVRWPPSPRNGPLTATRPAPRLALFSFLPRSWPHHENGPPRN